MNSDLSTTHNGRSVTFQEVPPRVRTRVLPGNGFLFCPEQKIVSNIYSRLHMGNNIDVRLAFKKFTDSTDRKEKGQFLTDEAGNKIAVLPPVEKCEDLMDGRQAYSPLLTRYSGD